MLARGAFISAGVIIFFLTPLLVVCEGFINKTSYKWRIKKDPVGMDDDEDDDEEDYAPRIIEITEPVRPAVTIPASTSKSEDDKKPAVSALPEIPVVSRNSVMAMGAFKKPVRSAKTPAADGKSRIAKVPGKQLPSPSELVKDSLTEDETDRLIKEILGSDKSGDDK